MKKISMLAIGVAACTTAANASIPSLAVTFDTNVYVANGTSTQRTKIDNAEQRIKDIIRSEAFKTKVLNHSYGGVRKFVDNGGLTNTQIYYKILNAAEKLSPTQDNEMDLKIKTYFENSTTVGFTSTASTYINMNTKFLNSYSTSETAKTMVHEWLHKLGFSHAVNYSTSRDYSVPYGVGRIIKELAATI